VFFSNLYDEGKIKIEPVEEEIETTLVYPLLRGREVKRWKILPTSHIIVSQNPETKTGFDLKWMRENVPKTLNYFEKFKGELLERSGYKKYLNGEPYYSIYNVGPYTFSPYKVVWKEQSSEFECAVVSFVDGRIIVPDHKLMLVDLQNEMEAHYLCAVLNSSPSRFIVQAYTISTQQSTHILENIKIPKYSKENKTHQELSKLSKLCHGKVSAGIDTSDCEEQIDELAVGLWGLTREELKDIKDSLEEIQ
jgi:hypothetical protein